MSLFNTQRKKAGNATAGETKIPAAKKAAVTAKPAKVTKPAAVEKKAVAVKAEASAKTVFIIKPRVTEKAGLLAEKGVYTFDVAMRSNAQQIAQEVRKVYKVTPVKVSVAAVPSKAMFVRGRKGSTVAGKKAYVYLKKGDKIEFI
jgi:large subunit ribosomal protein L23